MILIFTIVSLFSAAQSNLDSHLKTQDPVTVTSAFSTNDEVSAGSRIPVALQLTVADGFSIYEDKIKINAFSPDGLQISDIEVKDKVKFTDFAKKQHEGLQNKGELRFFVELPQKLDLPTKELLLELQYVACTIKVCLPIRKVTVHVPVRTAEAVATPATTPASPKEFSSVSDSIEDQLSKNIWLTFLIVFGFGLLTSLTPCVYPLIPITLAVIGARSPKKSVAFMTSLVYVHGIALTYSILGVIAAKTGTLFGKWLSYPPVLVGFSLLFFLMALSLFGLFEIRLPHFLTHKLSSRQTPSGYIGAFLSGLIAGVIASPCVGPVLVGILTYIAKTQDAILGFFLLFTFAMGMGVLLIVVGTFTSLVKALPRSGEWMNKIKVGLGMVMVGVSVYYIYPLLPNFENAGSSKTLDSKKYANGWQPYSEDALKAAKAAGKPVIIDFFADWCAACIELDKHTFSKPEFIASSREFVLLKVDATESFPELSEMEKTYRIYGLPTIIFIDRQGNILHDISLAGFEEIEPFLARMKKAF